MFEALLAPKPDAIFDVLSSYKADIRPNKVNLGIGIYQTETGDTPVFEAVKEAERRLVAGQTTKAYLGLAGDEAFSKLLSELVLDGDGYGDRLGVVQAPGGTGSLRVLFELIAHARPGARVWVPQPTWPNHPGIISQVGLSLKHYPYFDSESKSVKFGQMMQALNDATANDVLLLHGCCHNPSGADLDLAQWNQVASFCEHQGILPLIDLAYQGLGNGLAEDAAGTRIVASKVPELLVAISCSKNFGLYRERTGCAVVIAKSSAARRNAQGALMNLGRVNYSMPPDHGAAVVREILNDSQLRNIWSSELEVMRRRMIVLRSSLSDTLEVKSGSARFGYFRNHNGMFSLIGASPEQVARLSEVHAIYTIGNGRINVAGLRKEIIEYVAEAFLEVGL